MAGNIGVEINEASFDLSSHNAVTGEICFRAGNSHFPERRWNDFPVVLLSWWIKALLRLEGTDVGCFEMLFMDGPFEARGILLDTDSVRVEFMRRGRTGEAIEQVSTGTLEELRKSIIEASERTLALIRHRKWMPNDADALANCLAEAKTKWK